jgi:hypothetical protein
MPNHNPENHNPSEPDPEELIWLNRDETEPAELQVYGSLAAAVLDGGRQLIPRCGKSEGIIAWHDGWQSNVRDWVKLYCYSSKSFRLSTIGTWFYYNTEQPRAPYGFELSFAPSEVAKIAKGLVHFVESAFASEGDPSKIWKWPLFAHNTTFPHYAWTQLGKKREEKVRAIREARNQRSLS